MSSVALQVGRQQIGGGHPSLDLNFVAGAWPAGLSFSRASGATVTCWARYGDNLVTNGDFSVGTSWNFYSNGTGTAVIGGGVLTITRSNPSNRGGAAQSVPVIAGRLYTLTATLTSARAFVSVEGVGGNFTTGQVTIPFKASGGVTAIYLEASSDGDTAVIDNVAIKELIIWQPGMDWLGPELVSVNGAVMTGANTYTEITGAALTVGRTYQLRYTINQSSGASQATAGGYAVTPAAGSVSQTVNVSFVATATGAPNFFSNFAVGTVSGFSVREQNFTLMNVLLPANVPRIAYDPVTGACLGAMVEPQRTNLVTLSAQIDQWELIGTGGGNAVSANAALAPDGTLSADKIVPVAAVSGNDFSRGLFNLTTSAAVHTYSVFVKAAGLGFVEVILSGNNTGYAKYVTALFNLSTGAFVSQRTLNYTMLSCGSQQAPNGFWRIWVSTACDANSTHMTVVKACSTTNPTGSFTGDGTSGVLVWGAQLEAGTEPTSYIPTAGAAATRAGDYSLTVPMPARFSPDVGTFVIEAAINAYARQPNGILLEGSNISGATIGLSATGVSQRLLKRHGSNRFDISTGLVIPLGGITRSGVSFDGNAAVDGTIAATTMAPAQNDWQWPLQIGSRSGGALPYNGYIRLLRYYPRNMTPSELQTVTK